MNWLIERLESVGATAIQITVDGIDYVSAAYRGAGFVDLYDVEGNHVAAARFNDETESVEYGYAVGSAGTIPDFEVSSDLYHEHSGKTEHDMAEDVGTWLAATHHNN